LRYAGLVVGDIRIRDVALSESCAQTRKDDDHDQACVSDQNPLTYLLVRQNVAAFHPDKLSRG